MNDPDDAGSMGLEREDLVQIITGVSRERMFFFSEDDFKFALAWKVKESLPKAEIRLEKLIGCNSKDEKTKPRYEKNRYIDIFINSGSSKLGIELKYKTAELDVREHANDGHGTQICTLKDQSAIDTGGYDCLHDIHRLENFVKAGSLNGGYAIWLTNDPSYWNEPKRPSGSYYRNFRIYEGRRTVKRLKWCHTKKGKMPAAAKGRPGFKLERHYEVHWDEYSEVPPINDTPNRSDTKKPNNKFRYCLIEVQKV